MITAAKLRELALECVTYDMMPSSQLLVLIAEIRALRAAWKAWNGDAILAEEEYDAARKLLDGGE